MPSLMDMPVDTRNVEPPPRPNPKGVAHLLAQGLSSDQQHERPPQRYYPEDVHIEPASRRPRVVEPPARPNSKGVAHLLAQGSSSDQQHEKSSRIDYYEDVHMQRASRKPREVKPPARPNRKGVAHLLAQGSGSDQLTEKPRKVEPPARPNPQGVAHLLAQGLRSDSPPEKPSQRYYDEDDYIQPSARNPRKVEPPARPNPQGVAHLLAQGLRSDSPPEKPSRRYYDKDDYIRPSARKPREVEPPTRPNPQGVAHLLAQGLRSDSPPEKPSRRYYDEDDYIQPSARKPREVEPPTRANPRGGADLLDRGLRSDSLPERSSRRYYEDDYIRPSARNPRVVEPPTRANPRGEAHPSQIYYEEDVHIPPGAKKYREPERITQEYDHGAARGPSTYHHLQGVYGVSSGRIPEEEPSGHRISDPPVSSADVLSELIKRAVREVQQTPNPGLDNRTVPSSSSAVTSTPQEVLIKSIQNALQESKRTEAMGRNVDRRSEGSYDLRTGSERPPYVPEAMVPKPPTQTRLPGVSRLFPIGLGSSESVQGQPKRLEPSAASVQSKTSAAISSPEDILVKALQIAVQQSQKVRAGEEAYGLQSKELLKKSIKQAIQESKEGETQPQYVEMQKDRRDNQWTGVQSISSDMMASPKGPDLQGITKLFATGREFGQSPPVLPKVAETPRQSGLQGVTNVFAQAIRSGKTPAAQVPGHSGQFPATYNQSVPTGGSVIQASPKELLIQSIQRALQESKKSETPSQTYQGQGAGGNNQSTGFVSSNPVKTASSTEFLKEFIQPSVQESKKTETSNQANLVAYPLQAFTQRSYFVNPGTAQTSLTGSGYWAGGPSAPNVQADLASKGQNAWISKPKESTTSTILPEYTTNSDGEDGIDSTTDLQFADPFSSDARQKWEEKRNEDIAKYRRERRKRSTTPPAWSFTDHRRHGSRRRSRSRSPRKRSRSRSRSPFRKSTSSKPDDGSRDQRKRRSRSRSSSPRKRSLSRTRSPVGKSKSYEIVPCSTNRCSGSPRKRSRSRSRSPILKSRFTDNRIKPSSSRGSRSRSPRKKSRSRSHSPVHKSKSLKSDDGSRDRGKRRSRSRSPQRHRSADREKSKSSSTSKSSRSSKSPSQDGRQKDRSSVDKDDSTQKQNQTNSDKDKSKSSYSSQNSRSTTSPILDGSQKDRPSVDNDDSGQKQNQTNSDQEKSQSSYSSQNSRSSKSPIPDHSIKQESSPVEKDDFKQTQNRSESPRPDHSPKDKSPVDTDISQPQRSRWDTPSPEPKKPSRWGSPK